MKKTKKLKRAVAYVLCMVMLVSSMLVVNAAVNNCSHSSTGVGLYNESIVSYNEGTHKVRSDVYIFCKICGTRLGMVGIKDVDESHSMTDWTDEGHLDANHHCYRLYCSKCGFSKLENISCSGGSSHATPW